MRAGKGGLSMFCSSVMVKNTVFFDIFCGGTPPKTDISPQKWIISIGNTSSNHRFSGDMLVFQEVTARLIFCWPGARDFRLARGW